MMLSSWPNYLPKVQVVFEDSHLCVLLKPAGLLSQGDDSNTPSLVQWAQLHFGRNYVGLIHRLDRNTQGLMVLAKRTKAAQRLTKSLQNGDLKRSYEAYLHGFLPFNEMKLTNHLLWNEFEKKQKIIPSAVSASKQALLNLQLIKHQQTVFGEVSHVKISLETGRKHQIRVQLAHLGFPILGEHKYAQSPLENLHLKSCRLQFPHPMTQEILDFNSDFNLTLN